MAALMRCHVSAPSTAGAVGEGDLAIIGPDGEVQPCAAGRHERPSSRGLTGGRGAYGGVQVFFEGNEDGGEQIRFVPKWWCMASRVTPASTATAVNDVGVNPDRAKRRRPLSSRARRVARRRRRFVVAFVNRRRPINVHTGHPYLSGARCLHCFNKGGHHDPFHPLSGRMRLRRRRLGRAGRQRLRRGPRGNHRRRPRPQSRRRWPRRSTRTRTRTPATAARTS